MDRVVVVKRKHRRLRINPELFAIYKYENKSVAVDFVKKKKANNNTDYDYSWSVVTPK